MTFISFAPNAEDVPLWRALCQVEGGRYLDWSHEAAAGPSVTRAFYDRGWRGVSVRPARYVAALQDARPLDTVTAADTGPLPSQLGTLHFLRIDAEGGEVGVLQHLDLGVLQPWVLVLPATNDAADRVAQHAQYQPVLFDGVSRFYLAPGQEALRPHLSSPANVKDDYLRAADDGLAERIAAMQATLAAAEARVHGSSQRLVDALQAAGLARDDLGRMGEEFVWLRGLIAEAKEAESTAQAESAWLREQMEAARQAGEASLSKLLARAEEAAWLRTCVAQVEESARSAKAHLAATEARLVDTDTRLAQTEMQLARETLARADAELRANDRGLELTAIRASTSWRLTAPLRRLRESATPPALPATSP